MSKQQAVYKIKAVLDVSDIKSNSKAIQNSLAGVKLSGNLKNQFNTLFNDLEREVDSFQQKMNEGFNNAGDIKALQKSANNITKIYSSITKEIEKISNKDLSQFADFDTTEIKTAKKELQELQKILNQKLDAAGLNEVSQAITNIQKVSKNKNIESFLNAFKTGDIETAQKSLEALRKSASGFSNQTNLTTFNAQLDKMEASLRQLETVDGLQDVAKNMQLLKTRIETLNADQIAKVMRYIDGLDTATREAAVAQQQYTDKV